MWEEANQTKKTSGYSCLLNPSLLEPLKTQGINHSPSSELYDLESVL